MTAPGRAKGDGVILMAVLVGVLVAGVVLTSSWGRVPYRPWEPEPGHDRRAAPPSAGEVAARYLRGAAIGLTGGFWAGLLVTGPAVRLAMRLLAVTGGDDAQGRITEADELVGSISLDGTIGLVLFGGVLPGLLSGAIYVVLRRLLPGGALGGVTFGALHLLVAATRIDPLRPGNPDFDLVGPGWLSVTVFGLAAVLHGMAVAAYVNRYSHALPPGATAGDIPAVAPAGAGSAPGRAVSARSRRVAAIAPLVPPALLLIPGAVLLVPVAAGLVVAVAASRVGGLVRAVGSDAAVLAGRAVLLAVALAYLPGAVTDLHDVVVRDDGPVVFR